VADRNVSLHACVNPRALQMAYSVTNATSTPVSHNEVNNALRKINPQNVRHR